MKSEPVTSDGWRLAHSGTNGDSMTIDGWIVEEIGSHGEIITVSSVGAAQTLDHLRALARGSAYIILRTENGASHFFRLDAEEAIAGEFAISVWGDKLVLDRKYERVGNQLKGAEDNIRHQVAYLMGEMIPGQRIIEADGNFIRAESDEADVFEIDSDNHQTTYTPKFSALRTHVSIAHNNTGFCW